MQSSIISLIGRQSLPVQPIQDYTSHDNILSLRLRKQSTKQLVKDGNVQGIRNLVFTPYQFDQLFAQIISTQKKLSKTPTHITQSNECAQSLITPNSAFLEIQNIDQTINSLIYYYALSAATFTQGKISFENMVQTKLESSQIQAAAIQDIQKDVAMKIKQSQRKLISINEQLALHESQINELGQVAVNIEIEKGKAEQQFSSVQLAQETVYQQSKQVLTKVQYQVAKKQNKITELENLMKVIQNYIANDLTQKSIDYDQMKSNFTNDIKVFQQKFAQLQDQETSIKLRQQTLIQQKQEAAKKLSKQEGKLEKFETEILTKINTYTSDIELQITEFNSIISTLKQSVESSKRCQRDTDALMARNQKLEEEIQLIQAQNNKLKN